MFPVHNVRKTYFYNESHRWLCINVNVLQTGWQALRVLWKYWKCSLKAPYKLTVKYATYQSVWTIFLMCLTHDYTRNIQYLWNCSLHTDLELSTLRWRHNDHAGVSNHQPHGCLLNRLFRRKSKKTSKLRVTGLCAGNSPGTGEFPAQMASYAENVSIWWRHHEPFIARSFRHDGAQYKNHGTAIVVINIFPCQQGLFVLYFPFYHLPLLHSTGSEPIRKLQQR